MESVFDSNRIHASIVTHRTDSDELRRCVASLRSGVGHVTVVDNSPDDSLRSLCGELGVDYIYTGRNLGYGAAHNLAILNSLDRPEVVYHLVINSDVWFESGTIQSIVRHMDESPEIGQLIPRTVYPDGSLQHVVRLLPTPVDLIARRFLPSSWTEKRMRRFLLEFWDHASEANVPYHQGSFMFFRTKALREVGLFDERFFMYPEDIDLTRRMHRRYRTVYWPEATIVHAHRAASYKSKRMLWIHIVNMIRYFCKWGWIFDRERREFNRRFLKQLNPNDKR